MRVEPAREVPIAWRQHKWPLSGRDDEEAGLWWWALSPTGRPPRQAAWRHATTEACPAGWNLQAIISAECYPPITIFSYAMPKLRLLNASIHLYELPSRCFVRCPPLEIIEAARHVQVEIKQIADADVAIDVLPDWNDCYSIERIISRRAVITYKKSIEVTQKKFRLRVSADIFCRP